MLTAKIQLKQAQKLKQFLLKNHLFNREYQPKKENNFVYFPLTKLNKTQIKNLEKKLKTEITTKKLTKIEKIPTIQQLLKNKLTKKQIELIPRTQEQVGSILVLEIPEELKKKEKIIAQAFLQINRNTKTVVKKSHPHKGTFRLRKVTVLAGEKTTETIHHENNIKLKIDLEKTYFSARLANERLRIAKQIKKPEEILVMFSGVAPYPLVIAKNSPAKHLTGIEINPLAHQLALENLKLNKSENKITVFGGDVNTILPKIKKKFDRILMPLPKTGELFLPLAIKKAKSGTIIHLYDFLEETKINQETKKIRRLCQPYHKIRILRKVKCGQFSPYIVRVCFDIKILK